MMSKEDNQDKDDEYKPRWAYRANNIPHKPDWIDFIPHELWELGEVFFPIPNRQKGWSYPHHLDEYRYAPDSEKLNAYLETNCNYGIACSGDLAVIDIDEKEYIDTIADRLPDTVYQVTGSRTGVHLFYMCEGLKTRINLRLESDEGDSNFEHIGEVKCDPHGYVVGPGSKHPSGNTYGPLKGESIATITKDELFEALDEFINEPSMQVKEPDIERHKSNNNKNSQYVFYNLKPDDVVSWLEAGKRVPHPAHGSSTGTNFMKQEDAELFMCWRHDYGTGPGCALNPQQLLAVMATGKECDTVRHEWSSNSILHYMAWKEAVERGIISHKRVPYTVAKGYGVQNGHLQQNEDLSGDMYWELINTVRIIMEEDWVDTLVSERRKLQ